MRQEAETEENNTDWSKGMLDINSDYKGWLTIYGTQISEPVVQGETNETITHQQSMANMPRQEPYSSMKLLTCRRMATLSLRP